MTVGDHSIPELLVLERHKHRLVPKRQGPSVLELEPQAVLEPSGRMGDSAWLGRSSVTEAQGGALVGAGRAAAKEATESADGDRILASLRAGTVGSLAGLKRALPKLSRRRIEDAIYTLLEKGLVVRDKDKGPVRLAEDD